VRPIVLEIRNNYTAAVAPDESAPPPCANATGTPMNPLLAELAPPLALYPSLITAAVTTLTTRTAHMRNFEGELERHLAASWQTLGIVLPAGEPTRCAPNVAEWIGTNPVHRFDLIAGDRLYPQGWMLSDRARKGMTERAECSVPYPPYASCIPAEARNR
jgi:hypothetical protein